MADEIVPATAAAPKVEDSKVFKDGLRMGIDPTLIIQLIMTFGPIIAEALMKLIERRRNKATANPQEELKLDFTSLLDFDTVKKFLAHLLRDNKDALVKDADDVVKAAIDAVIAFLEG